MPYRDQATVNAWVRDFLAANPDIHSEISVLEKDYVSGPESGLVAVAMRHASTVTYIQAVVRDDHPTWIVTFEARPDSFDLDAVGVSRLAEELSTIARIALFLQDQTDLVVEQRA
ncbi:protein-L-isoaspartate carboxylmethyltransferase [Microbacterium sp. RU33B]|uniref:protein-L-isoaspartate carboxylmethyltransferase n=1 Tax=Microbacterium sp. RU33B TaxID=1907390 RepID=UPI00096915E2|nr:protein-L-isoaspartate carboxylmethyltransferase [Microbacterium sp. RU33B]SIT86903.1 hypothetical protein SAMN05880545_2682 [Microbacterium sp. RU33B]